MHRTTRFDLNNKSIILYVTAFDVDAALIILCSPFRIIELPFKIHFSFHRCNNLISFIIKYIFLLFQVCT